MDDYNEIYRNLISKETREAKNKVQSIFDEMCVVLERMGFVKDFDNLIKIKTFLHRNSDHELYGSALFLYNEMIKASVPLRPMAGYVVRESSSLISGKVVK